MFHEYRFTFDEVRPSDETIMHYLQINEKASYQLVDEAVRHVFDLVEDSQEIVGGYNIVDCLDINAKEGTVTCANGVLLPGRRISAYMKGATRLALFICTAGKMFTDMSHAYQSHDDFLEAFVVESIGSATVENAMDKIQKRLQAEMESEGLLITNRYSPGYCEWPLVGQKALFAMIGDNDTCITLTDSCLMQPIKSVSGIIGIGEEVKEQPYGCAICGSSTCVYRKILINKK
jgi:hypothetical protein